MGLASWFIGYIAAPAEQIPAMQSQKQIMAICTSTAAQYAALEASGLFDEARPPKLAQLTRVKSDIIASARSLNLHVVAGDARNVIALRTTDELARQLRSAGYDFADGAAFGAPDLIRLNVGGAAAEALQALR